MAQHHTQLREVTALTMAQNNVANVGGSLDLPQFGVKFRVLKGTSPLDVGEPWCFRLWPSVKP